MNRRQFLGLGATAGVTALGLRSWQQGVFAIGQGAAYTPWNNQHTGLKHLIGNAILAATPHNTQAWKFRINKTQIDIFDDPSRSLGAVDPLRREMTLGLGAALENLLQSAQIQSFSPRVEFLSDTNNPNHVARVWLMNRQNPKIALHEAIAKRHTNRAAYETRSIAPTALKQMKDLNDHLDVRLIWLDSSQAHKTFENLTIKATQDFIANAAMSRDSEVWYRHNWAEIQEQRDGITIDAQGLSWWLTAVSKILPAVDTATANTYWLNNTRMQVATAPMFGIIAIRKPRDTQMLLKAGQLYQRLALWATLEGLVLQALNQVVELRDHEQVMQKQPNYAQTLATLTGQEWHAVMPFRIGYAVHPSLPSPRRSVESVLL